MQVVNPVALRRLGDLAARGEALLRYFGFDPKKAFPEAGTVNSQRAYLSGNTTPDWSADSIKETKVLVCQVPLLRLVVVIT